MDLNPYNFLQDFEKYEHIWQTRNEWRVIYAPSLHAEENDDQYAVIINDKTKEYMIAHSYHLENGYQDEYFTFVTQKEQLEIIEKLKKDSYKIIPYAEEYYYMEINEENI